jgi:hypothetical protein
MVYIVVDVETTGAIPHKYEMTSIGAVILDKDLKRTFYSRLSSNKGYMEVVDESVEIETPEASMLRFEKWILENSSESDTPAFVSDNNGFDWQFINYYFHTYIGHNPFGFSSRRIGDLYAGLVKNMSDQSGWRKLVKTTHTHHPVDDAVGHAEALLEMINMGLKISLSSDAPVKSSDAPVKFGTDEWCSTCKMNVFGTKLKCDKCGTTLGGTWLDDPRRDVREHPDVLGGGVWGDGNHGAVHHCPAQYTPPAPRRSADAKTCNNIPTNVPVHTGSGGRPGDWWCTTCKFNVFGSKPKCGKCNQTKPNNIPTHVPAHAGSGGRPGDWWCTNCDFSVFGSKPKCGKCGQVKH